MMQPKIDRAGLIPAHINENGEISMFFMKPSDPTYGGPDFQIAKGKLDSGENSKQAAIREAKEELGLFEGNITSSVEFVGKFLGRTDLFVCLIDDPEMFGLPDYETGDTAWMTESEFMATGRPLHRPLVQSAVRFISLSLLKTTEI